MKKNQPQFTAIFVKALTVIICFSLVMTATAESRNYYQLKVYHYKNVSQENKLDQYFQQALIPALHRQGVKNVGVFKPVTQTDTDKRVYVFIPFASFDKLAAEDQKLQNDKQYLSDGKQYIDADYKDAPYSRIETIILQAFPGMPQPAVPNFNTPKSERVYELRSYESATEKYNVNKVHMFNNGDEIGIFKNLNFNAVFYSEVISGSHMPNLMYMTTFNNQADREKHWQAFGNDPKWKSLVAMDEYKNNVSHMDIVFLHPMEYSEF